MRSTNPMRRRPDAVKNASSIGSTYSIAMGPLDFAPLAIVKRFEAHHHDAEND